MRITNNMMMSNFLSDLNHNMTSVQKYQDQLSSGQRIRNLSDDPVGIITALGAKEKLNKLDMHTKTVGDANSWLKQTETSLDQVNETIKQVYEETVKASNGTLSATDKQAEATFIEQMRQQIVQAGNSTFGGRYIFGGYNTTTPPFTYNGVTGELDYNGVDLVTAPAATTNALGAQVIQYATGVNVKTDVSINGVQLMGTGTDNLNQILTDLVSALNANADSTTLQGFVDKLNDKQQDVLSQLADVGGRTNRLNMMADAYSDDESNYTEVYSNVVDADIAQATMDFKMAQAVYTSALQVGSMVIQPTLVDFLK